VCVFGCEENGRAQADKKRAEALRPSRLAGDTRGVLYHYCGVSDSPIEDGVLRSPFDDRKCLAANIEAKQVIGVECVIHDGRADKELNNVKVSEREELSKGAVRPSPMDVLDTRGMFLKDHESQCEDFWSLEHISKTYLPEMQHLSQVLTQCDRAAVAAHTLRSGQGTNMARGPAHFVHNDFSNQLRSSYMEMIDKGEKTIITDPLAEGGLGISAEQLSRGRLVVLNYWRPLQTEPLQRNPLAVLDSSTMQASQIVQFPHFMGPATGSFMKNFRCPTNPHVNVGVRPDAAHKWYYFPGMTRSEVIVFKNYDSEKPQPGNGVGMHTSFDDPRTPSAAPARESVEVRVLCFWFGPEDRK